MPGCTEHREITGHPQHVYLISFVLRVRNASATIRDSSRIKAIQVEILCTRRCFRISIR
jgi:hypothetical protein